MRSAVLKLCIDRRNPVNADVIPLEMYRINSEFVERLRDDGHDVWTISLWENWLTKMPELESAILQIDTAFQNTSLGDGIGLREANAIDDYATDLEREHQRQHDEKHNWRNIGPELLNQNYVAPTYFDAEGFCFHLPAFLIADLNGQFNFDFIDRLIEKHPLSTEWILLIDDAQAKAIMNTLELLKHHPEYHNQSDTLNSAITRIRDRQNTNTG